MPSRAPARARRGGRPQGGYMPVPSTRTMAALAYERGEEFDPGVPPLTAALVEDLTLVGGAPPIEGELSAPQRRPQRDRDRRATDAAGPSWFSAADLRAKAFGRADRAL